MPEKPKVAFYWCASCGGCEEAIVDLAEDILKVVEAVDIVLWPVALDFKKKDVEAMPDDSIAVAFINGAVRMSEQEEWVHLLRRKSQLVVAFGSGAHLGGIPGLANFTNKTEIFANAFGKAAAQKVAAVAKVVADPVGTAKAVPGGVARFAKGLSRSAMSTADKMMADMPAQGPDPRRPEPKAQDAAAAAGGAAESFLISGKRREWAGKVGADPYTTNQALASKLDDVGWAAYAGGFALSVAAPSIPGLGMVETADQLVYQLPPAELLKRNDEKLKAAGVSDAARKALLVNGNFTPTLQTELASAVAGLGEATGKSEVVTLAAQSRTEGDARYIRRCVQLLARGARGIKDAKSLGARALKALGENRRVGNLGTPNNTRYVLTEFYRPLELASGQIESNAKKTRLSRPGILELLSRKDLEKGCEGQIRKKVNEAVDLLVKEQRLFSFRRGRSIFFVHAERFHGAVPVIPSEEPSETVTDAPAGIPLVSAGLDRGELLAAYQRLTRQAWVQQC